MELKDIRLYNADYHKDGTLVWREIGSRTGSKHPKKKKQYNEIPIEKIQLPDSYDVDERVFQESKELYAVTNQLIPVYLSFDFRLISGFEQYELAKQLGIKVVPFLRRRAGRKEQKIFAKTVSDHKFLNKKYSVHTKDGQIIYVSYSQKKNLNQALKLARLSRLHLQVFRDFTVSATDNDGNYFFGSQNEGIRLKGAIHKLEKTLDNNIK